MNRLADLLGKFSGKRVLVVGDLMLDEYIWGTATRISPEAPVMVIDAERETNVPGGAANVAHNIVSLGGHAELVGVVGGDLAGERLRNDLAELGISTLGIVTDPKRRTTRKTRVIAHHQQVLRVDRENRVVPNEPIERSLLDHIGALIPGCDAVILSDYRKGCLTDTLISATIQAAGKQRCPVAANSKPASAPLYEGASLVSLNRLEAETLVDRPLEEPTAVVEACSHLPRKLGVGAILVTLGEQGIVALGEGKAQHISALLVEVYDTAGAGDTVIASCTLAMAAGAPLSDAVRLANIAAGCVVRKVGVATATPEELLSLAESGHASF